MVPPCDLFPTKVIPVTVLTSIVPGGTSWLVSFTWVFDRTTEVPTSLLSLRPFGHTPHSLLPVGFRLPSDPGYRRWVLPKRPGTPPIAPFESSVKGSTARHLHTTGIRIPKWVENLLWCHKVFSRTGKLVHFLSKWRIVPRLCVVTRGCSSWLDRPKGIRSRLTQSR